MVVNRAIEVLKEFKHNLQSATILYKVLFELIKKEDKAIETRENLIQLYILSVELFTISNYNPLIEAKAYTNLLKVLFANSIRID